MRVGKLFMALPLCCPTEDVPALVSLLDDVLYETPPITTSLFNFCKQAVHVLEKISIMTNAFKNWFNRKSIKKLFRIAFFLFSLK